MAVASNMEHRPNHGKLVLASPIDSATSLAEKSSACACIKVDIQNSNVYILYRLNIGFSYKL